RLARYRWRTCTESPLQAGLSQPRSGDSSCSLHSQALPRSPSPSPTPGRSGSPSREAVTRSRTTPTRTPRRPPPRQPIRRRRRPRRPISPRSSAGFGSRSSIEHVADELLDAPLFRHAFLVLRGDELRQQAERDELDPHDDEKDTERKKRALADMRTAQLDRRQVDEDDEADRPEEDSESAEEMERPVAVPTHERHRQEVEEGTHV